MSEIFAGLEWKNLPQVGIGTAVLAIFGACVLVAVLRGVLRLLVGSIILCASGIAGYLAWRHTPEIASHLGNRDLSWLSVVAPVFACLATLLILRFFKDLITRPFGRSHEDSSSSRSPRRWGLTLLLCLVPAALVSLSGATAVRNVGSIVEIQRFVEDSESSSEWAIHLANLKSALDRSLPESWLGSIDPLAEKSRVNLAKLIAAGDGGIPPRAIPVIEEPELRNLILHNPDLRALAKAKRYSDILRDPRLDHVMADPDLKRLLQDLSL
ncbi:MAG: hypothetical protein EAZ65_00475 [Verrucomicrobia bacterium]|nr:MAG: hypothetical protein EAZ84_12055 [Verrucomicrobiota bacterium]TAE89310.1 MAG: hypothetical protein EAZ82_01420 [Verrucomicrobiota bacterium]TAF27814.1 MAG: hypothetical protein EAZ71_00480 [Verrucomicrobiota bacterium]TAF42663.1 MAG: hypothetical protein EAZ65_00475 [Verrucomicrobiota bacterium]